MEKQKEIPAEMTVKTTELAAVLGVTARRIQQMEQDGTIVAASRGRYILGDSVQRYISFVTRRTDDADSAKMEKVKLASEASLKKSKAEIAKLEAEELRGKMHRSEDVAAMTEDLIYSIRGALHALPGRLAVDTAAASTPAEEAVIIRKEVNKIMGELAGYRYDSDKYAERVRERRNWEAGNDGEDDA